MIIPKDPKDRDPFVKNIIDVCMQSRQSRLQLYAKRREYFLFGSTTGPALYNRLGAHVDLVSSFLYSPDHAKFSVTAPRNSPDDQVQKMLATEGHWNDDFRDCDLAYQYGEALLWGLVYDNMFIKPGWNDARDTLFGKLVDPGSIGVYNEAEPDIDSQEAICHRFVLGYDNAVQRLVRAGLKNQINHISFYQGNATDDLPWVAKNLLVTGPMVTSLGDNLMGQVSTTAEQSATYRAETTVPVAEFFETWIWDDVAQDYVSFTNASPDILLSDSRETIAALSQATKKPMLAPLSTSNIYLPQEHPFIQVQPFPLPDYFWGESHCERLIPLQNWSNRRLLEIQEILAKQTDPPRIGTGFMGLTDEKMGAFGGPGSFVMDQLPGAKIEELAPKMPADLFAEFESISRIFLECSGLTQTITGQGETGVHSAAHARQITITGSGRIRKIATGLERSLSKLGEIGIKLKMRNSDQSIIADDQSHFFLSQIGDEWKVRVAAHSHSPLFRDETKDMATALLKYQAIDQEAYIRMIDPPNADALIAALRKRNKIKAQMAAAGQLPEQQGKKKAA